MLARLFEISACIFRLLFVALHFQQLSTLFQPTKIETQIMRLSTSLLIALVFYGGMASAQEKAEVQKDTAKAQEYPLYEFEPVEVTATRAPRPLLNVPFAIDVVGPEEIQRGEATISLSEALRGVPGVSVNDRQNFALGDRIVVRGLGSRSQFGVRGMKILLDGIPLTLSDGQSFLNNLDLGSAARIEVIRGPAGALYGNSAGGVILIQTRTPPSTPVRLDARVLSGSYGLRKWDATMLGRVRRTSYHIAVNQTMIDGFREHSEAKFTKVNALAVHEFSGKVQLTTVFNVFDAPYLINPGSLSKSEAENSPTLARDLTKRRGLGTKPQQAQAGLTLRYDSKTGESLESTVYGIWRSVRAATPDAIHEPDRIAGGARVVFRKSRSVGSLQVNGIVGADADLQRDEGIEFANRGIPADRYQQAHGSEVLELLQSGAQIADDRETVSGLGSFAQLEIGFNTRWIATLAARYDRFTFRVTDRWLEDGSDGSGKRTMDEISPTFGLTYRPRPFLSVYGNYATAFQSPTRSELSNLPTGEPGVNPTLQPERLRSFEIGAKGILTGIRSTFNFAGFVTRIENMLIPYQIPGREEIFFRNAGQTKSRGFEVALKWEPLTNLSVSSSFTAMAFEFDDYLLEVTSPDTMYVQVGGNRVPGLAPSTFFGGLSYRPLAGLYAEINVRWVDQFYANDFNGPPPGSVQPASNFINDGYTVVDCRMGYERSLGFASVEVFGGVNNLLDERYNGSVVPNASRDLFFEPAPDRNWYAGARISVNP